LVFVGAIGIFVAGLLFRPAAFGICSFAGIVGIRLYSAAIIGIGSGIDSAARLSLTDLVSGLCFSGAIGVHTFFSGSGAIDATTCIGWGAGFWRLLIDTACRACSSLPGVSWTVIEVIRIVTIEVIGVIPIIGWAVGVIETAAAPIWVPAVAIEVIDDKGVSEASTPAPIVPTPVVPPVPTPIVPAVPSPVIPTPIIPPIPVSETENIDIDTNTWAEGIEKEGIIIGDIYVRVGKKSKAIVGSVEATNSGGIIVIVVIVVEVVVFIIIVIIAFVILCVIAFISIIATIRAVVEVVVIIIVIGF
jgi:hypothetical protein